MCRYDEQRIKGKQLMICPKCNQNNKDGANFCRGCGADLRQACQTLQSPAGIEADGQKLQNIGNVCPNCGKALKLGAAFCVFCGTKIEKQTELFNQNQIKGNKILEWVQDGGPGYLLGTLAARLVKTYETNRKLITRIVAVLGVVIAVVLVISQVIPKVQRAKTTASKSAEEEYHNTAEDGDTPIMEEAASDGEFTETEHARSVELANELEKLWDQNEAANAALEAGSYAGEGGCRTILDPVIDQYIVLAEEYGAENDELQDAARTTFDLYTTAILGQTDLLLGQDVRPELYEQMMSDFDEGLGVAEKLLEAELYVDKDYLEDCKESISKEYYDRYIGAFNSFTEAENWSRTESWDLMQDAEKISFVDLSEKDDPMTQRYAYALARITMKNIENEMNDGRMAAVEATEDICSVMEETDYNLLLLEQLIDYYDQAGDTESAENAKTWFQEIVNRICDTQGLLIGEDVRVENFWSFNEFDGTYWSDSNGMTRENHEWIREYMQDKF